MSTTMKTITSCAVSAVLPFLCAAAVSVDIREPNALRKELSLERTVTMANGKASWGLSFRNVRAHNGKPRRFAFSANNGSGHNQSFTKVYDSHGVCGLIDGIKLTVNGIPWDRLQLRPNALRQFTDGEAAGIEAHFNFDGASVRFQTWLEPESPLLKFEVAPLAESLRPVTGMVVHVSAIPSFLDYGPGKKTKFKGYRRQVRSDLRFYPPRPNERITLRGDERLFALEDADYDGSADGKGMGPSGIVLEEPCPANLGLNEWWTTDLRFSPAPSRPFRFSILEFPTVRTSNDDFFKALRSY